ncbi:hypothetical protein FB645_003588 [Coemansia sp. IMI 203386]|nr:hypothetical protein FB645_003588 [Coemansia sp. IMI 203386]
MASNTNSSTNGSGNTSQYTLPSKELDWWSEDAMVRFGTNTQKSNEPAWQDVGANVLRMDSLYDASFHDWLKCEDNVSIIASYLQRIANEYPMDRIINALRWLVSSWRLESTAVIVRHITSDWAMPQNPPKPNTSTSFLMDAPQTTLQSDPSVLAGEARRGVLVRELTKDWTCQQIAQLVGMLSLTFWSERSHLEAFLKTLVSDWDFCRLSSFFSYVSGQLGLDYRVKVSMLQQAARRNASRLSLKRARNGTSRTAKDSEQAASRKENAELEEEDSSKRARHESSEYAVVSTSSCDGAAASADSNEHDNTAGSTHSPAAIVADATSAGRSVAPAVDSSASSDRNSSSGLAQVLAAEAATVSSSSAGVAAGSGCGEPSSPVRTGGASAPIARTATSLSARAFRSGHMPAPLCTGRSSSSHMRQPSAAMEAAAAAGPATTPSSPAVPNAPVSPPATASVHGCMASQPAETTTSSMDIDTDEIQSSSSSTDLASLSYTRSQSGQQQQRRRSRNNTSGASSAPTNASSPLVAGTGSCSSEPTQQNLAAASSSSSSASATATASVSSAASASAAATSPSMSTRRPLTPQIASGVFIVAADSHHQSSPSLRRQHRHNRSYQRHECQQPLTPTHSTSSLSLMGGASARVASAQSGASSATSLPTRPAMRSHAASISTTTADSPSLLVTAASNASSPNSGASASHPQQQQQDLQHGQAQGQGQEFRARTASESELGQFDGPASTHLALPLPSESTTSSASLCGRTSAAPYDVLGIVMSTETEHHQLTGSSV